MSLLLLISRLSFPDMLTVLFFGIKRPNLERTELDQYDSLSTLGQCHPGLFDTFHLVELLLSLLISL